MHQARTAAAEGRTPALPSPVLPLVFVGRIVLVFALHTSGVADRGAAGCCLYRAPEERPLEDGRGRARTAVVAHILRVVQVLIALAVVVADRSHPGVVGSALGTGARRLLLADDAAARMALQAMVDALAPTRIVVLVVSVVFAPMAAIAVMAMVVVAPAVGVAIVRYVCAAAPEVCRAAVLVVVV